MTEVKAIRFAVGEPEGRRSSVWRMWANKKGDAYLSVRSLGGQLKVSLHKDGRWHYAFDHAYAKKKGIPGRFVERWERPEEFSDGFTLALRIYVPESGLSQTGDPGIGKKAAWIPAPKEGMSVEFTVMYDSRNVGVVPFESWPGKNVGTHAVAFMDLGAIRDRVWLLHRVAPTDQETVDKAVSETREKVGDNLPSDTSGLRLVLWGTNDNDGSHFFVDTVL